MRLGSTVNKPTDDLDEILASPARPGSKECHVCWALTRLDPATADKMRAILDRRDIPAHRVRAAFASRVTPTPGLSPIRRHRDRGCEGA